MDTPGKDALVEMNWVSLLEKQWTSVKQTALMTPLVFRWNGKPREPKFIQAELVVTERRRTMRVTRFGLMTMDQNHWNSAELIVLLQAIRSFNVPVMVTACVVQMMTVWRRQAVTCTTPQIALALCPPLVLLILWETIPSRPFTPKVTPVGGFTRVPVRVVNARAIATTTWIVLAIWCAGKEQHRVTRFLDAERPE
jgi:hypothetical protein